MSDYIRIANVIDDSIVDGPGIRMTIFFQGCAHNCEGCFNKETWDFNGGHLCDIEKIYDAAMKNPLLQGITLSGGDPIYQVSGALKLVNLFKNTDLDIMVYTGFTYEELLEMSKNNEDLQAFLQKIDYLVDGKFDINKKDIGLKFRGSSNQRIIDIKKTILNNKIITTNFND